ncbi:MAG TPA: poly-gamma-glutamate system protein [Spirochaetota bacterium]|nr:poly-gamma-glutamate system protein [Spirochaetota bacterium]HPC40043.1 poly-gamma-glutamate system protein [Spirochaetota bacterium]HPL15213.1 poly-gamma-glutamate system protein [Spirochaetota bacterium]HQF09923.1 poly-gamma-glutamate system protein [Spirochaetota bacterium]HQH98574.1 poly-gamma-glutamate system protein [Spirochaetota bacterium]
MKKLIWKPSTVSWQIHLVIAIMAVIGLVIVESFKVNVKQPYYREKVLAARYMMKGMEILKRHRLENIGPINKVIDPMRSGLIGVLTTPITSTTVDIDSKLTSINPNWAAVIVSMLKEAKVKNGSTVAVSLTGSFPAMNLAVFSAAKALNLRLIIITSVSASTWGANIPGFTWLDMENVLHGEKFSPYRSVAASLGGVQDNALGMSEEGKTILRTTIRKYNITLLEYQDMKNSINARMEIYYDQAKDSQIAAYINVGGGTVAIGSFIGKKRYRAGLNLKPSQKAMRIESVMSRFARNNVPILNINYLKTLAQNYRIPIGPKKIPKIGQGEIYYRQEYNKAVVAVVLAFLLVFLFLFMKLGIGYRIFIPQKKSVKARPPEHMV